MQQASYLEGGPLMWTLPLYLHINQISDDDDDDDDNDDDDDELLTICVLKFEQVHFATAWHI